MISIHAWHKGASLGAASLVIGMLLVSSTLAQVFPAKPVKMLLSMTGGGETNARIVAQRVPEFLGVPLVVEANSAAGGAVAVMNTVRAEPDGYTILYSTAQTLLFRPYLVQNNPYHPVRDLTAIIQVGEATQSIASSLTLPAATFSELLDYARRNPGKVAYATTGLGTTGHLAGSVIARLAGIDMVHVPYKGGTQALPDLMDGRVQLSFTTLSSFVSLWEKGKIRVLAITQGSRSERFPEVPLVADVLPGYEVPPGWIGIMGPARMPSAVVKRIADAIIKAANLPEVKARTAEVGTIIKTRPPEEFAAAVKSDFEIAGRLIKGSGVQPE